MTFMNSFSMAASKKQLLLNSDGAGTGGLQPDFEHESKPGQNNINMPGFVSEPNFEDEISIEVEDEDDDDMRSS